MELLHEKQEFHFYMNCVPLYNEVFTFDINTYRPLTSKDTHSVCELFGNMSTGVASMNLKPCPFRCFMSLASVAGSQDT